MNFLTRHNFSERRRPKPDGFKIGDAAVQLVKDQGYDFEPDCSDALDAAQTIAHLARARFWKHLVAESTSWH